MPLQLAPTWPQWHFPTSPTVPFHLHQQISPPFRCLLTGMCRMSRCFARHCTKVVMAFPFSPRLRADTNKTQLNRWRNLHLRPQNKKKYRVFNWQHWYVGGMEQSWSCTMFTRLYVGLNSWITATLASIAIFTYLNAFLEEGSVSLTPLTSDLSIFKENRLLWDYWNHGSQKVVPTFF